MAGETLRTASQLLVEFPDNTAGLIDAVNSRNFIVSATVAVAFLEDAVVDTPYTMPMADGVPTPFLPTYPAVPDFVGNFWKLDGNNQILPSYTDQGVTVPAGVFRLVSGGVILEARSVTPAIEPLTALWNYTIDVAGNPGNGEIFHNDPAIMRVNKQDALGTDHDAYLIALPLGSVINTAGQLWTVDGSTDAGNWMDYDVSPAVNLPNDVRDVTFTPPGSGDLYEFQGTSGGQLTGNPIQFNVPFSEPKILVMGGDRLYEVALAEEIDFNITPIGHDNDLIIEDFRITLQGIMI